MQKNESYAYMSFKLAVLFILSDNKALIEGMQNKVAELESKLTIIDKHLPLEDRAIDSLRGILRPLMLVTVVACFISVD